MVAPLEGSAPMDGRRPPHDSGFANGPQHTQDARFDGPPSNGPGAYPENQSYNTMNQRLRPSEDYPDRDSSRNVPPGQDRQGRELDQSQNPSSRDRSRTTGSRRPSGSRKCEKCGGNLTGQFVRALGGTYHLECFTCHDCGKIVASKFFPVPDHGPGQYPLCETDYFKRLDLLCYECGGALRGSYITALDRKYHIEHFTCSVCPTVFGAQDSYYEHEGNVYCHYHYSTKFAQRCNGCQTAILKQFVEIFRNGQNQHWHPECYMIHKYWNVRLHSSGTPVETTVPSDEDASEEVRRKVRAEEEKVEEKVLWIWRTLSQFEERSATCISDMLLHVSNGAYVDGVMAARKFIVHVDLLFAAADNIDQLLVQAVSKGLSYAREAKLLCKKVVAFFQLLSGSQKDGVRRLGVTQELLALVTGLAHYLKLLIRICLQGSLKLERETGSTEGLTRFLEQINSLDDRLEADDKVDTVADSKQYVYKSADTCPVCDKPVEDRCVGKDRRVFHVSCVACRNCGQDLHGDRLPEARWSHSTGQIFCQNCASRVPDAEGGFFQITRLRQYVHLLKVAHARLLAGLRASDSLPHTSDDPNLMGYDSRQGHRVAPDGEGNDLPLLRSSTRSKSYAGASGQEAQQNSYEQTVSDIRRLRSTRLDKHLSTNMRTARTSRIMDGPEGSTVRPGSAGDATESKSNHLQIVQDRDANGEATSSLSFGVGSIALDDIPRIVAAEQAREQRPNAAKYARGNLVGNEPQPKLVNGHRREYSDGQELERAAAGDAALNRPKRFFSDLSALEYFIVRHVAVISLEPLLDGQWNQEQLLDLIETRRPTFWNKWGKAFKNDKPKAAKKQKGIFGKSLEQAVERDAAASMDIVGTGTLKIPSIVEASCSAMRTMDMSVEGVFRKNGNIKRLKEMQEEIDTKGGESVDFTKESPVQVAALLKRYLRALPDPVLTFKLHKLFLAGARIQDDAKRRRVMHLICCLLPKAHRDTMEVLFCFLHWASSFHTVDEESGSKMDIHNLATVIAPNILYADPKVEGKAGPQTHDVEASFYAIEAVHTLIECNETMCEVPEDFQSILSDSSLWGSNAELTTKEILKRYGDVGKVPHPTIMPAEAQTPRSREGRSSNPVVKRVDTDPQAWQTETSVRHVGGPGGQAYGSSSTQGTPPTAYSDLGTPNLPYAHGHGNGSNDSASGSPNRYSQSRPSGFQKQGPMGIAGTG